jgi:hypothetical protein
VAAGERWSAFFDTTEVYDSKILDPRLRETAERQGARLYVCDLVIEERAFQRLRDFNTTYARLRSATEKVQRYVKVEIGERKSDAELLEEFRNEERGRLETAGFIPIPVEPVTADGLRTLRKYLDPRIEGKKGQGVPDGLNDAIILLSGMKYAQTTGLNKCLFVSENTNDFSDRLVQGLGRDYGQEWRFITDVEAAIFFLQEPDVAKAATEFIRSNSHVLLSFIEKERAKWPDDFLLIGPATLLDIEAFTDERPVDGAEMQLRIRATVRFALLGSPALYFHTNLRGSGSRVIYAGVGSQPVVDFAPQIRVIEGRARARYEKSRFVGELNMLEVRPVVLVSASDVL